MKRLFLVLASAAMICSLSSISSHIVAQPRPPQHDQGNHKPKSQHKQEPPHKGAPNHKQDKHKPQHKPAPQHKPTPSHKPAPHHSHAPHHTPAPHHSHAPHYKPAPYYNGRNTHVVRVSAGLKVAEDPRTGLYGYLNNFGVWVIAPTYRNAKSFDREIGLAVVRISNGNWGAIDGLGQTAILFNFSSQFDVESAIRSMKKGRYRGIDLWEECDPATNLWGYLDYTGNWYLAPQFLYAKSMSDRGVAVVKFKNNLWGAITRDGKIVIQPNFTSQFDVESAIRDLRL